MVSSLNCLLNVGIEVMLRIVECFTFGFIFLFQHIIPSLSCICCLVFVYWVDCCLLTLLGLNGIDAYRSFRKEIAKEVEFVKLWRIG